MSYTKEERRSYNYYYKTLWKIIEDACDYNIIRKYEEKNGENSYAKLLGHHMGAYIRSGFNMDYTPTVNHETLFHRTLRLALERPNNIYFEIFATGMLQFIDVDRRNKSNETPLMIVVRRTWHTDILPQIISQTKDINAKNNECTALDYAVLYSTALFGRYDKKGDFRNIKLLLDAGATTDFSELWRACKEIQIYDTPEFQEVKKQIDMYLISKEELTSDAPASAYDYEL